MGTSFYAGRTQHVAAQPVTIDALIIGAGVAALYRLHQLRKPGMTALAVDKASDVGGTWYWNRYPGAKFDSEAYIYQYLFHEDLYERWSWSERFPSQSEIELSMHYVADALDLRRDLVFSTSITDPKWDADRGRWTVRTDRGDVHAAQVLAWVWSASAPPAFRPSRLSPIRSANRKSSSARRNSPCR